MIGRSNRVAQISRPAFKDTALQRFAEEVISLLESRDPATRNRGNALDKYLTRGEAVEIGLLRTTAQGARLAPAVPDRDAGLPPFMGVPPAIEGLEVGAAVQNALLFWPNQSLRYANHSYVEVWRAAVNDLGQAVMVGQSGGTSYADPIGPGQSRYYWARNISQSGTPGPFNAVAGLLAETGVDVAYMLSQLSEQITESQLFASLAARIDLIDGPDTLTGSVSRRVKAARDAIQGEIDTINSTLADIEGTPDFDSADSYALDDLVKYNGALYRCIQATTAPSPLPTDAAYWEKIGDYGSLGDAVAAHAAQLSDHETRVTDNEGGIAARVTAHNTLAAAVNDASTGLATKASSTDLTTAIADVYGAAVSQFSEIDARFSDTDVAINARATITALNTAVSDIYGADVSSFTKIEAQFNSLQDDVNNRATVAQLNTATADAESGAVATATQQVATALTNGDSDQLAAVETKATSWDGVSAQWTIKTQVADLVGGVGLLNDGEKVRLYVQADEFALYGTDIPVTPGEAAPFVFSDGSLYLKSAMIEDATITVAKMQSAFADDLVAAQGKFQFAQIDRGDIFDLTIGELIASGNYAPGSVGWIIGKDGTIEFNGGTFRGAVEFTSAPGGLSNVSALALADAPAEAGANITETRASANTNAVGAEDVLTAEEAIQRAIAALEAGGSVKQSAANAIDILQLVNAPSQAGADVTGDNTSADTNQVAGVAGTEVAGVRTHHFSFPTTSWYRVFSVNSSAGRGGGRFRFTTVGGGNGSPGSAEFAYGVDWSGNITLTLVSRSSRMTNYVRKVRVTRSGDDHHIDVEALASLPLLHAGYWPGQAFSNATVAGWASGAAEGTSSAVIDFVEQPSAVFGFADSEERGVNDHIENRKGDVYIGGDLAADKNTAARVNNWVRPSTTLIDGNKLYTGTAYVDTLVLQGDAVTHAVNVYEPGWAQTNNPLYGIIANSKTTWTLVAQLTISTGYIDFNENLVGGATVRLEAFMLGRRTDSSNGTYVRFRVARLGGPSDINGIGLWDMHLEGVNAATPYALTIFDDGVIGTPGTYTYELYARLGDGAGSTNNVNLFSNSFRAQEIMR